jgi:Fe-S cluster assembly protein SufD
MMASLTLSDAEAGLLDALPDTPAGEAAREALATTGLPNRRVEAFRWSDLRAALAVGEPDPAGSPAAHLLPDALQITAHVDGIEIEGDKPEGVVIASVETAPGEAADPAGLIVRARAPRTLRIEVEAGASLTLSLVRAPGAGAGLELALAPGAQVLLVERAEAAGGFGSGLLDATLEAGARLERVLIQRGTDGVVELSEARVSLAAGADFGQTGLLFGARLARAGLTVRIAGEGARCRVDGAYLLGASLHGDFTTRIEHAAPGGTTSELFKGAVKDRARGVFQGKILVERAAQKTDARQNHHALMLNEGCEVDAKPELEIYADDVACAHGNTIGALDEASLFYMRQRGIPLATARALLVRAFITEALAGITRDDLREALEAMAASWLGEAFP